MFLELLTLSMPKRLSSEEILMVCLVSKLMLLLNQLSSNRAVEVSLPMLLLRLLEETTEEKGYRVVVNGFVVTQFLNIGYAC